MPSKEEEFLLKIRERLRKVREQLGLSISQIAEKANIYRTQYFRYEKGQDFQVSSLYKLKQAIPNLNLNWLITGEGEMFIDTDLPMLPLTREALLEVRESTQKGDYVIIPFYSQVLVSAGSGIFAKEEPAEPLIVPKNYLRKFFGLYSYDGLFFVPVHGTSMEPTIPSGSIAVVKAWETEGYLFDNAVYVLVVEDLLYIKRVQFDKQKKKIFLISDNQKPTIELEWDDRIHIIGRVVGIIQLISVK